MLDIFLFVPELDSVNVTDDAEPVHVPELYVPVLADISQVPSLLPKVIFIEVIGSEPVVEIVKVFF